MAKSILVITDIHETNNCSLKKAHDIAVPLGDKIEAVRFIKANNDEQPDNETLEQQSQTLASSINEIFDDYQDKEAISSQVVVTDDIVQWVVNYCDNKDFDLVIKAGHRSETLFHTPCDWRLIRSLQVPVLIASQKRWRNKHALLAAIDPTDKDEAHHNLNNTILKWTKKWALTFDCPIHLVYCLPVSNILKELDIINVEEYADTHRAEAEAKLNDFIKDYDLPNVNLHITAGVPDRAIPQYANKLKAELVIMGSTGRQGLKGLLKGNIAEKVMHNLRTDSLVIER